MRRGVLRFVPLTFVSCALALSACSDDPVGVDAATNPDASVGLDAPARLDAASDSGAGEPDATADAGAGDPDATPPDARPDSGTMPRSIVFVHTNDEHSHQLGFAPEVDDVPPAAPNSGIAGGLLRRSVVIDRIRASARAAGSAVSQVSAGDQMMGSMFHLANPSRGIDYAIATLLGYDAMTLGNHEFDFGADQLAGALRTGGIDAVGNPGIVQIPILTTNIRFSSSSADDDTLASLYSVAGDATHPLRRTFIKTHGGIRVGYLGLLGIEAAYFAPFKRPVRFSIATDNTACTSDAQCPGTFCVPPATNPLSPNGTCAVTTDESDQRNFVALVTDAATAVAELRAQGVDMVVALSHIGVDDREIASLNAMGIPLSEARSSEEILLAKNVNLALAGQGIHGIDLIVGGHSHSALTAPIVIENELLRTQTVIVQAGSNGLYVGKVRLVQESPTSPWTLDTDFSGLEAVDETVDPRAASAFFTTLVSSAIDGVVQGLESTGIAANADGFIFPGEQCDVGVLPNRGLCSGLIPGATGGTLSCYANRQLNLSACQFAGASATCGNGAVDGLEQCDGPALGGNTCASLDYASGNLSCHANCTFNLNPCVPDFPSLLEVVVNFAQDGAYVRDQPGPYDLFFYRLGHTSFDIPEAPPSRESNLLNLVTDAERDSINRLIPDAATDPVRIVMNANGVIRDGIYQGRTGALTVEDLFRVLPLGISPAERTPTYSLIDFWFRADEVVRGLELGVSRGLVSDSFWLGVSGARVEYDLSRNPGERVMRVTLTATSAAPFDDQTLDRAPIFDRANGGFVDPARLIRVGTSFYIGLFLENLGFCPRDQAGAQIANCRTCATNAECTLPGSTCDVAAGRCASPVPAAVSTRTLMPFTAQELKEFLALTTYVRQFKSLPDNYAQDTPRRLCCVGAACPADDSRTCD